jgi:hypothetical protein
MAKLSKIRLLFGRIFYLIKFELEHFRYVSESRKIKNLQIWGSLKSATNLGQQIANPQIAKSIGSANCISANCHTFGRSTNVTKFCKASNLRIFRGLEEDDS